MKVGVILLLLNRDDSLIINNKVNRERGIFESNINIKNSIN